MGTPFFLWSCDLVFGDLSGFLAVGVFCTLCYYFSVFIH